MFTPLALALCAPFQGAPQQELLDVAPAPGGGVAVLWRESDADGSRSWLARLDARGALIEAAAPLSSEPGRAHDHEPALAFGGRGGALVWCRDVEGEHEIRLRTIAPDGAWRERDFVLARHPGYHLPAVAVDEDGEALVAWLELDLVMAARLAADGTVLDAPHRVTSGGIPALERPVVVYAQDWLQEVAHIHFEIGEGRGWTLSVETDPFGPNRIEPGGLDGHWGGSVVDSWFGWGAREHVLASESDRYSEHRLVRGESGCSLLAVLGVLDMPPARLVHPFEAGDDQPVQFRIREGPSPGYDVLFDGPNGPSLRRYDSNPIPERFDLELSEGAWEHPVRIAGPAEGPRFAASRDGLVVAWTETRGGRKLVRTRCVNAAGEPGEARDLSAQRAPDTPDAQDAPDPTDDQGRLEVTGALGQGFAVLWSETVGASARHLFVRLDAQGAPREAARELSASPAGAADHEPALALGPRGHGALAWCRAVDGVHEIRVRTFSPDGALLARDVVVDAGAVHRLPALAVDDGGEVLVAWLDAGRVMAARLAADGSELDPPRPVRPDADAAVARPRVAYAASDHVSLASVHWRTGATRGATAVHESQDGRIHPGRLHGGWTDRDVGARFLDRRGDHVAASFAPSAFEAYRLLRGVEGTRIVGFGLSSYPPDVFEQRLSPDPDVELLVVPRLRRGWLDRSSASGFYVLERDAPGWALQRRDFEDDPDGPTTRLGPARWTPAVRPLDDRARRVGPPRLAADGTHVLVAWTESVEERLEVRYRLVRHRKELGEVRRLPSPPAPEARVDQRLLQLTAAPGQGFAALWSAGDGDGTRLLFGRLDAAGALREPPRELSASPGPGDHEPALALGVGGHGALAWCSEVEEGHALRLRTFAPHGALLDEDVLLGVHAQGRWPALAVDREGQVLAAWLDGGELFAARLTAEGRFLDSPQQLHRTGPPAIERPRVAYSTGAWGQTVELHARTGVGRSWSLLVREEDFSAFAIEPGALHARLRAYDARSNVDHEGRHVEACFGFDGDAYHRLVRSELGVQVVMRSNIRSMHPAWIDHLVSEEPDCEVAYWPGCERPRGYSYMVGLFLLRSEPAGRTLQRHGVEEVPHSFGLVFGPPVWEPALRPFADRTALVLDPALAADGLNVVLAWTEERDGRGVVFARTVNAEGQLGEVRPLSPN